MTGNCGYPDAAIHPHVDRCYRGGAVDALREAAADLPGFDAIQTHGDAAKWLRDRADSIERSA